MSFAAQVSSTTANTYLPGLSTTINAAITAGLNAGITAQAIAAGGVSSMYLPRETRIYSSGNWTRPANSGPVIKLILVGGGGSGGCGVSWSHNGSGGGGAGQLVETWLDISSVPIGGTIPVTIGQGGAAVGGNSNGNNGGNSSFGSNGNNYYVIAYGGGGGGYPYGTGNNGNSGNMGAGVGSRNGGGSGGGGGAGGDWQYGAAGGGGGAGGAGQNSRLTTISNGTGSSGYQGGFGFGPGAWEMVFMESLEAAEAAEAQVVEDLAVAEQEAPRQQITQVDKEETEQDLVAVETIIKVVMEREVGTA